jgi:hypothetical protein
MPKKTGKNDARDRAIADAYCAGASAREIRGRFGITTRILTNIRVKWNLPDLRQYAQRGYPYCLACRRPLVGKGGTRLLGKASYAYTCGRSECKAAVEQGLVPIPAWRKKQHEIDAPWAYGARGEKKVRQNRKRRRLRTEIVKLISAALARSGCEAAMLIGDASPRAWGKWEALYELTRDTRGDDRAQAHESPWSEFSRVPVLLRLQATTHEQTALTVALRGRTGRAAFVADLLGPQTLEMLNARVQTPLLLVWACACPRATRYLLEGVEDVPDTEGIYGLCPLCGSAALEVLS